MLEVRLIGKFDIRFNGEPVILSTRAAQSLFAFLILSAGTRHRREKLAGIFWPDAPEGKARAYLRHELWRIRKAMSAKTDAAYLQSDDISIFFDADAHYWLDVDQLSKLSAQASAEDLMRALQVYGGELLPGFYEDWVTEEREHVHALFDKRIGQLLKILEDEKRWQEIPDWGEYWLTFFPGQETAYQYMIRAYQTLGDRAKANEVYERCVQALRALDLEPSETTRAQVIKRNARLNLPIPLTSFIGRQNELKDVADLLKKSRLVTLTGSGGVGKTRLAIHVVAEILDRFPDGVWFLDLASLNESTLVPTVLANLLRLRESGERPTTDLLINYFQSYSALIIFDNCEHLIESCAELANSLLTSCEHLSILATSREALRISGEIPYRVPSLEISNSEDVSAVKVAMEVESVRLFVERAMISSPAFTINSQNALGVVQICRRLDGIPLAIELAAARVNMLSVDQILKRLDDRFNLLTGGLRSALPRHQTLHAMIEWSYSLISKAERLLFMRLAVFMGGWTLEAAEDVCSGNGIESSNILDLLSQLVNKSLILVENEEGETRYHSLETIRQFAREKLFETGEATSLQNMHLDYFLKLTENAEPHLRKAEQIEWLKRLEAEHENLRTALAWAMDKPSAEQSLRLVGALGNFWYLRSYCQEGAKWMDRALAKTWNQKSKVEMAARAKALYRRADIAETLDELDTMRATAESALALCQKVEDAWGIAFSHTLIAHHQIRLEVFDTTFWISLEQSLKDFHKLGDAWGESRALQWQAYVLTETGIGSREEFLEIIQTAIARGRTSGDRARTAFSLVGLAIGLISHSQWDDTDRILQEAEQLYEEIDSSDGIYAVRFLHTQKFFACGDLEQAKAEAKQVIEYWGRAGERNQQSTILCVLALIAEAEHDLQSAEAYSQKALELAKEMRLPVQIGWTLILVGIFKYQQAQVEIALQSIRDSLELVRRAQGQHKLVVKIFDHLARLLVEKNTQAAVKILSFAESLVQLSAVRRDPIFDKPYFDSSLSTARARLSDVEFTSAWEEGSKISQDEAITFILKVLQRTLN